MFLIQKCVIFAVEFFRTNHLDCVDHNKNKMNIQKKSFFSLLILLAITAAGYAQNTNVGTNSPYGRYGYGILSDQAIGASEGMGGISYGLRRSQQVNPGNPASYSVIDTMTMVFDMGTSVSVANFSDNANKQRYVNGNLDYIAMQFPIGGKLGASVGLIPYSKTGYKFGQLKTLPDLSYTETFTGTGGLSQIYGGLAVEPFKNFSAGVNVSYLFGNYNYNRLLSSYSEASMLSRNQTSSYRIRDLKYDLGLQYTIPIKKSESVTLGVVYTPAIKSKADIFNVDANINSSGGIDQLISSDTLTGQEFHLPHSFGAGFTYAKTNLLLGLDASYQLWEGVKYPSLLDGLDDNNRFNNRLRVNAGGEYVIDPFSNNFMERVRFRAGLSYSNSYTNVSIFDSANEQTFKTGGFNEYGVTFGVGVPFLDMVSRRISTLNLNFGYKLLQPNDPLMIKQQMFTISLNANINEFWFFKRQFD